MTAKTATRRREAAQDIHSALDALLPHLKSEEIGRLAADFIRMATRPQIFLKVMSFARTIADDPGRTGQRTPPLKLVGGGHGELIDVREGVRRLDSVAESAVPEIWAESELLGPEAMIEHLGVSRSTLHNWRRDGRVISVRKGLRNHLYPVRQFAGKTPLAGIAEVLAVIGDGDETWEWLVTPNAYTEGKPPLALLERGQVDVVRKAADSALDFA
jgi:hypothetical protein